MEYDYIIVGSGFGGSVSALRLSQKGYRVLVVEKGQWFQTKDFPKTNWNVKKWLWMPQLRFFSTLKLFVFKHIAMISANPSVNPSLSITAIAERAINQIPYKKDLAQRDPLEVIKTNSDTIKALILQKAQVNEEFN